MTNHFLAGATIALVVQEPVLALVLAFASHFVLDSLPHYGEGATGEEFAPSARTKRLYVIDSIFAAIVVGMLVWNGQWLALLAALVAFSPDTVWIYRAVRFWLTKTTAPRNAFSRFHESIQREFAWGWVIEIAIAGTLLLYIVARTW